MSKATLLQGDCMELMSRIPDGSIDMVLSDLPYGTTRCRWDTPINLQELWKQYRRVVKENGAIVLFSAQPFTTELISSNKAMYRYEWIWRKTQPSGFMNAKKMPLRTHENIEIFYRKPPTYNPQMTHGHKRKTATAYGTRESDGSSCYGREERNYTYDSTDRYPVDVLQYSTGDKSKRLHPTQKPVDLLEYLVKTYTNSGETVLDNCMGAGSTGVACLNTGREFVGIELDPEYNKKMEEQARQLHEKALAGKWCCTCEYCIPVDPNLPGFVTAFPECEYGGMAVETCSRYRVAGTTIRNSAWADRIRERFMRVV
jgi:DNA modification methylase